MIDGHAHACGRYLKANTIIDELDKEGVSHVVLVPGEPNNHKEYSLLNFSKIFPNKNVVKITNVLSRFVIKITGAIKTIPLGNEYVYSLSQETRGRVIQFLWITKESEDVESYLNSKYESWDFKGVKLHQCWEEFSIKSGFFKHTALWCERNDLPLFIHLYSDEDVCDLIEYKINHPKLKLIVAHLFGLELFIKIGYKDNNLYFDISPYQLNSNERIVKAIECMGSNHLLMGSDTPYGKNSLSKSIDRIKRLNIPENDKTLILGENMKNLLRIKNV